VAEIYNGSHIVILSTNTETKPCVLCGLIVCCCVIGKHEDPLFWFSPVSLYIVGECSGSFFRKNAGEYRKVCHCSRNHMHVLRGFNEKCHMM
jgi:hypothetical protein